MPYSTTDVNEARKILFCRDNRSIENIPPTKQALIQHILRSAIQSSKWCQCLNAEHILAIHVSGDGKKRNKQWNQNGRPYRRRQQSRELIKCGCKKCCSGKCKCSKADLECPELRQCSGQCANNSN